MKGRTREVVYRECAGHLIQSVESFVVAFDAVTGSNMPLHKKIDELREFVSQLEQEASRTDLVMTHKDVLENRNA